MYPTFPCEKFLDSPVTVVAFNFVENERKQNVESLEMILSDMKSQTRKGRGNYKFIILI